MPYMLLIMEPNGQRAERTPEEGRAAYDGMVRFGEELRTRGVLAASESLAWDADAARVDVRDGKRRVVDGPFAEAKEFVGGFFLLNCDSRDEAIAIAQHCPAAQWCSVEVRRIGPCFESGTP